MSRALTCQQCPVCKINRLDGQFYFSHQQTPATPQQVAARVCYPAKNASQKDVRDRARANCINACTEFSEADGYQVPSWDQISAEMNRRMDAA